MKATSAVQPSMMTRSQTECWHGQLWGGGLPEKTTAAIGCDSPEPEFAGSSHHCYSSDRLAMPPSLVSELDLGRSAELGDPCREARHPVGKNPVLC